MQLMGPVNYKVHQLGRHRSLQLYHINLLKRWHYPAQALDPVFCVAYVPQVPPEVPLRTQFTPHQRQELQELVSRNQDVRVRVNFT